MKRQRFLGLLLLFSLTVTMVGCGQTPPRESMAQDVELLEPVGMTASGEAAMLRDLYDADIYSATVVPYVEEYGFDEDVTLREFGAFPGETVSRGEVLAYSDTEKLDKQIEDQLERIQDMETEFAEYEQQVREDLEKPREEVKQLEDIVKNLEKEKPEQYLKVSRPNGGEPTTEGETSEEKPSGEQHPGTVSGPDADGPQEEDKPQINPAYEEWVRQYDYWNGRYRIADHGVNTTLLQLEQRTALYELDHDYALQQLQFLRDSKNNITIHSGIAGNVVALGDYAYGDYIEGETPIVAVGDPARRMLKCDYINRKTAATAQEMYAVIDGIRYEVEYVPMESDEYTRLTTQGETVYSTLYLEGDIQEVNLGDYAAVVVVHKKREQALSVPAEAVHRDETGSYVYVANGEENIYTSVSTGMSDGVYTEILSGIAEGDVVRLDQGRQYSDQRVTVERGSFHSDFSGVGIMAYPSSVVERSRITHGTVYFQEFQTAMYQHVDKGDVIATVRVAEDEIGVQRLALQLQRQLERVQDLVDQGEEKNKKAIENRQKEILKLQEQITELMQDYQTTVIRASQSGIVIWMADLETEDILQPDSYLVEIADENTCYVVLENEGDVLSYGDRVQVRYQDREEQERETTGMVASLNGRAVSRFLRQEYAFILLPPEVIGDMSVGTAGWGGWWNRAIFDVEASLREMDNVLIVPRRAVRESEGHTYVNVVEPDGSIVRRSFIAGGFDKSNYWVVEGLTEGMELCLE